MKYDKKIDIIFPFVDCNDVTWQKLYYENLKKYKRTDLSWDDWATGMKRFRPNGTLKYVFRSIEKYCPWVNKVHLIVQSESQIPKWVNRNEVNIVYHSDFIPEQFLPTFNSSTIEMFIQNVKELSEYYIYGNDDTIFTSPIKELDFFDINNKKLIFGIRLREFNPTWIGDILRMANNKLLDIEGTQVYSIQHTFTPHIKSLNIEMFNKYKERIYKNVTPFRNKEEHNQWIFLIYAYLNNYAINYRLSHMSVEVNYKSINRVLNADLSKFKSVCINDHKDTTEEQMTKINEKLEKIFPTRCKYEI